MRAPYYIVNGLNDMLPYLKILLRIESYSVKRVIFGWEISPFLFLGEKYHDCRLGALRQVYCVNLL